MKTSNGNFKNTAILLYLCVITEILSFPFLCTFTTSQNTIQQHCKMLRSNFACVWPGLNSNHWNIVGSHECYLVLMLSHRVWVQHFAAVPLPTISRRTVVQIGRTLRHVTSDHVSARYSNPRPKGPTKQRQYVNTTSCDIVTSNVLHTFDHPVATYWKMLDGVGSSLKMVKLLLQQFWIFQDVARVCPAPSQHLKTRSNNVARCCVQILRASDRALTLTTGISWAHMNVT